MTGHLSRENSKRCRPPVFTAALFTIVKTWKQSKCPWTEEGAKRLRYTYTMEHYSASKKNAIIPFEA